MLRSSAHSRSIALVNFILRWDKAHTKSAALYTGVTETETTLLAASIPGAAHIGNPMQLKNPILGLCQQSTFMLSAAKVDQCPDDEGFEVAFAGRSNAGKSSVEHPDARQPRADLKNARSHAAVELLQARR